jgi:hypothetical protein
MEASSDLRGKMDDLLTLEQVAEKLHCSPRHVRRLKIPIVRIGRIRLYDQRDLKRFVEEHKCLSSSDRAAPTTTRSSSSAAEGLSEALALHPIEMPKSTSENLESRLPERHPRHGRSRRLSPSIKLVEGTGKSTAESSPTPET